MATIGGYSAFTERAKDVIVQQLRAHFSLLLGAATFNALKEQPNIEKFGLAGQTSDESYVQVVTQLPHDNQRIPTVAIMSAPGNERKMGLGRQVVETYHDATTGKPMIREIVGGDMNIIIEISAPDTNQRAELTDVVWGFFTTYTEETKFAFLGDTNPDSVSGVPNNYQIILKAAAVLGGETDQPRPNGETYERIYFNRITVPITFLDYADREGFDVQVSFNSTLTLEDDDIFKLRNEVVPLDEPVGLQFVQTDNFEVYSGASYINGIDSTKWHQYPNPYSNITHITGADVIRGNGSVAMLSLQDGMEAGALVATATGILSGKIRTRFNLKNGQSVLVLFAMMQGSNPLTDDCYQLIVGPGENQNTDPVRLQIVKGPIVVGPITPLAEGSRIVIPSNSDMAAQLEWKIDTKRQRIRLRGWISVPEASDFGSMNKRLEVFDNTSAFLTSLGQGAGFRENPKRSGASGTVIVDDIEIIQEIGSIIPNPAKIG